MKQCCHVASVLACLMLVRGCGFSLSDAALDGVVSGVSDTIATIISTAALGFLGITA